jgi:uncharacterized membrane-anchored protein
VRGTIRTIWGAPFAVLSVAAFGVGVLFHQQALRAAASEAARQELGSCCHPAAAAEPAGATESTHKETRSKLALGAGLFFLAAAIAPAAMGRSGGPAS